MFTDACHFANITPHRSCQAQGTKHKASATRDQAQCTRCQGHGTKQRAQGTRHSVYYLVNVRNQAPCNRQHAPGTKQQDTRHHTPITRDKAPNNIHTAPGTRHRVHRILQCYDSNQHTSSLTPPPPHPRVFFSPLWYKPTWPEGRDHAEVTCRR